MEDRKARLAALAAKAGRVAPTDAPSETTAASSKRSIHFRNYIPSDPQLNETQLTGNDEESIPTTSLAESSSKRSRTSERLEPRSATQKDPSILQVALEKARSEISNISTSGETWKAQTSAPEGMALSGITRKKINEDLKRNIQPQLDRLQKRTQRAIVSLLRERLEKEAAQSELD